MTERHGTFIHINLFLFYVKLFFISIKLSIYYFNEIGQRQHSIKRVIVDPPLHAITHWPHMYLPHIILAGLLLLLYLVLKLVINGELFNMHWNKFRGLRAECKL